jgi:hypothetical protein
VNQPFCIFGDLALCQRATTLATATTPNLQAPSPNNNDDDDNNNTVANNNDDSNNRPNDLGKRRLVAAPYIFSNVFLCFILCNGITLL